MTDPTAIVVSVLSEALPGTTVSTEVPQARPARAVMESRTGSWRASTDFVDRPTFDLVCWGESDEDASALALSACHALSDAAEGHPLLSACEVESIGRDEYARTGAARYRAIVNLTVNSD